MEKSMSYKTAKGTEIKVVVFFDKVGNGFTQDGYTVKSDKVSTISSVRFIVNNNLVASGNCDNYAVPFNKIPGKDFVCGRLPLTVAEKNAIDEFIASVIAEYETPAELAEIENAAETKNAEKIYSAEEIKEAERKTCEYNNLYNEGGEGYVPNFLKGEEK